MDDRDLLRYSRHILLNDIDIEGQQRLLDSTAMIVGCGGLGTAAAPYLAAAGIGHIILIDGDTIDDTNLQRQVAYTEADINQSKAHTLAARLQAINSRIHLTIYNEILDTAGLTEAMRPANIVLDCTDNFSTRQAINQASLATKTPLVSGAAVRFEGQIAVYRPDIDNTPCYACVFEGDEASDGACATFGVFSPLVGVIGTTQAIETLKILMDIGSTPHSQLRTYNALTNEWQRFSFTKNPLCQICNH